ncbi:EAL domain-containing protein [Aliiglaciecola litoralis]|uniref:Uncharacterized protein n=1 Tax=Aliiglaciecola litoralis TaxID=582857 RepID=A0ABN1LBV0_9ALTE
MVFINSLDARELRFKHLSQNNQLPAPHINHIAQIRQGFMLFSTTSGARLFDGNRFIEFNVKNAPEISPLNANVYTAFEDSNANLWFATSLGLYKLTVTTSTLQRISHDPQNSNSLIDDNVRVITEDAQKNLWFGTLKGASRLNVESNQFTHFTEKELSNQTDSLIGTARMFLQPNEHTMWFGTNAGLYQINLKTSHFERIKGDVGTNNITSGIIKHDNQILIGTHGNGLYQYDSTADTFSNLTKDNSPELELHSDEIWSLFEDEDKKIWFGYWDQGLSVYDPKNGTAFHGFYRQEDKNSLPNKYIEKIFADSSGLIWIATITGAATFDPINFSMQTLTYIPGDKSSIGNGMIFSIEESANNDVWIGTENGIEKWSMQDNLITHFYHDPDDSKSITPGPVWALQLVGDNHLLAGTNNGVDFLNIETGEFTHFRTLHTDTSKDFEAAYYSIVAKSDEWFYVTGLDDSVFLLNPFSGEQQLVFDASQSKATADVEYFISVLLAKNGDLWLGSTTGVFQIDLKTKNVVAYSTNEDTNRLSDNHIYSLIETDMGVIWAATENGGINKIDTSKTGNPEITVITMKQGLPSNRIHNLSSNDQETIWFTTNKHLGSLDTQTNQVKTYSVLNANERGYREGALKLGDDQVVYVGDSRLRRFHTDMLMINDYQPQVVITGVSLLHRPLADFTPLVNNQLVELNPMDTLVTFEFASFDFASAELNQYRYKLQGKDKEWLYPGTENKAYYTHLPAGEYQLKVQGTNRDGLWSPHVASLDIIMHPPFYLSYWAYLVYALSVTLLLLLVIRAQKNKRLIELESMNAIKQSEARLRDVLWGSGDVLWRWNIKTNQLYNTDNSIFESLSEEEVIDFDVMMSSIHPDDQEQTQDKINRYLKGEEDYYEAQFRMLNKDSSQWAWVLSRGRIVEFDEHGEPLVIAGTRKSIDDIKQTEKQLRYLADYDQLTGLPNRTLFQHHLNHSIETAKRFDEKVALLYLDLDAFKQVNDVLGHSVGDQLLQAVSSRLKNSLRSIDRCSRLGGDEFAIIIERLETTDEVLPTLHRLLAEIAKPYMLNDVQVVTTASVGVAIYPDNTQVPSELLKHADFAMYEAKRSGKKHFQFYNAEMNALFMQRLSIENELKFALEKDQFEIFYQPRISVADNSEQGYEALIRWHHPERGLVSPGEFIPIAEETGQILEIGNWVLLNGCNQGAKWYQQGWRGFVSINIAALQFQQSDLVGSVKEALAKSKLPAACLELEITESTLIKNIELTRNILLKLKKIGVRIALDDFGTGYSSLSYLQQLPIDTLKIDRSFINLIPDSLKSVRLCTSIINMAHSLDLKVVAEGIEQQAQLEFLSEVKCEEYQGFLYAKPKPVSEIKIS